MIRPADNPRWPGRRTEAATLFLILLVAGFFRVWQIDLIPPGFTHDEADHGRDATAILQGARPIYETVGYGREPLYDYAVAALMPIFGANYLALRITSVLAGLLLIVIAHFWIRRAFDVPIALLTSAFLAVSFWAISTDRQALRSALLPTLFTAAVLFAWQAIKPYTITQLPGVSKRILRIASYLIAGLLIGLTLYTYLAARVLPGIFVLLWLYLLIFHRSVWKENWWGIILMIVIGVALALPMFYFLSTHPAAEIRVTLLSGPIDEFFAGDPKTLIGNIFGTLGMFIFSGDTLWLYNNPGQPILNWALSIMFCLGLVISFVRFRKIEYAFAIFWLLIAIVPSLLTGVTASSLRSIAAQPVVYLIVAIGLVEAVRFFERVIDSHTLRSLPLIVLLAATTIYAYHDYFDVWGQARDVRVAYHHTLAEVARYLDRSAGDQLVVAVSSIYPNRFHDPASMQMLLKRSDLSLHWFTSSFVDMTGAPHASLVFPQSITSAAACDTANLGKCAITSTAMITSVFTSTLSSQSVGSTPQPAVGPSLHDRVTVILQAISPIDPLFADIFNRHAEKIESINLRPDDFNPRFEVYRFDSNGALSDALKLSVEPTSTLDFGHDLALIGAKIQAQRLKPGDRVEVITVWRITAFFDQEAVLFSHVLSGDPQRPVLAQQDSLDVPAWQWIPGDAFAQVHRFVIPADAKAGEYPLEVGIYTREDNQRLPLYDQNGSVVSDHFVIGSVTVAP
jgi:4-amino-4-deoxy-L-arabinose transferase-like glycosyltransferase